MEFLRWVIHVVVELNAVLLYVSQLSAHFVQHQFRVVVEEHADRVIAESVPDAVLVGIVDPFRDPEHGNSLGRLLVLTQHNRFWALKENAYTPFW